MIKVQASVSKSWLHTNGGFSFPHEYYFDPVHRMEQDRRINEFVTERFGDLPIYNMEDNLVQAEYVAENQIVVGAIQPNMILAAILGAEFVAVDGMDADVNSAPLKGINDVSVLPPIGSLLEKDLIKQLDKQVLEMQKDYPECRIIPPFFWDNSGRATIHGIFTTSLKLIGEDIMLLMVMSPEFVHAVHKWIVDAYSVIIKHYSDMCALPITSVHVGECSGTMLSPEMYREFVVPYASMLGEKLSKLRLHSCGNSNHLIEVMREISNFYIIDTGSGTSVKKIRDLMGLDFEINLFPPMPLLLKDSPLEKIEEWLKCVISENNGGKLKLAYHLEENYSIDNCMFIHNYLNINNLTDSKRIY